MKKKLGISFLFSVSLMLVLVTFVTPISAFSTEEGYLKTHQQKSGQWGKYSSTSSGWTYYTDADLYRYGSVNVQIKKIGETKWYSTTGTANKVKKISVKVDKAYNGAEHWYRGSGPAY
ncbi:hypothetical protein [Erysipelothrix rhusiopathiae]|uniref:hypothetical protein n=1 Tax=Erysipelothrix rhusiopathiae TaxID=1648 RepID=UPI0023B1A696|nr:hypothetical protein [Erysipelothrix rhusiopathiae]MDE8166829.1 hypothetical protein [Erysipelothrix rhusiopathiae]